MFAVPVQQASTGYLERTERMTRIFRTRSLVARTVQGSLLMFAVGNGSRLFARAPTLTSISPNMATASSPPFPLTATGTNFDVLEGEGKLK